MNARKLKPDFRLCAVVLPYTTVAAVCALLVLACAWPVHQVVAADAQVERAVEVVQAVQAVAKPAIVVAADKPKQPEKPVDAKLEKEIVKLKADLAKLKKGTPAHDLKESALKRKQRELDRKIKDNKNKKAPNVGSSSDSDDSAFADGALLETDTEVDDLLKKAVDYLKQDRYVDACTVWQHVLDNEEFANLLTASGARKAASSSRTRHNFVYRPVRDLIENHLKQLPPQGLREYRIKVDPEARVLLLQANQIANGNTERSIATDASTNKLSPEESLLSQIVRRYFISSHGDDAAYRLGNVYLDQYDFVSARRLFNKVLYQHPDSSVPRSDLLIRAAIASARVGDVAGSKAIMAELSKFEATSLPSGVVEMVQQQLAAAQSTLLNGHETVDGWPMALGSPTRSGIMASLKGAPVTGEQLWTEQSVIGPKEFSYRVPQGYQGGNTSSRTKSKQSRREIVSRWEKGKWMPTAQAVMHEQKLFIKTHDTLRWYDMSTRKLLGKIQQPTNKLDRNTHVWIQNTGYYGNQKSAQPTSTEEIAMFGDRVAKSMSIIGDAVYHIEGRVWMGGANTRVMAFINGKQRELPGHEKLCAVNYKTGDVKWRYPGATSGQKNLRVLAAPVAHSGQLLMPVEKNGELHFASVDAKTGNENWTRYLCRGPGTSGNRWATVGVSIVGSEVYIATGFGVVFTLDAVNGNVQWATRYKRSEVKSTTSANVRVFGIRRATANLHAGFDNDTVIPVGDKLLVVPSDADQLYCFSRIDGKLLYLSPRKSMRYCLGMHEGGLYLAGNEMLRRYSVKSGKLEWEATFSGDELSLARGALTADGIYIPQKTGVLRIDPASGKRVGFMKAATSQPDPIGNLFTDGNNLVALGLDRVYLLSDGQKKMSQLSELIASKDNANARLDRAFLYEVLGKHDKMVSDLRIAIKLLPKGEQQTTAGQKLLDGLLQMADAVAAKRANPDQTPAQLKTYNKQILSIYDEAEQVGQLLGLSVRVWLARGRYLTKQGEIDAGLALFMKVSGDTSDELVPVSNGGSSHKDINSTKRKAKASLAAAAEIRNLVEMHPDLAVQFAKRGQLSLDKHLKLAAMEDLLSQPGQALPQVKKVQQLAQQLAQRQSQFDASKVQLEAAALKMSAAQKAVEVEKNKPTGQLNKLALKLDELVAQNATLSKANKALESALMSSQKNIQAERLAMAASFKSLADLKNNRSKHADDLLAIAMLYPASSVSRHANLLAAKHLIAAEQFARAELVLEDLANAKLPENAAAGKAMLAKAYADRKWFKQAHHQWQKLSNVSEDVVIQLPGMSKPVAAAIASKQALADLLKQTKKPLVPLMQRTAPVPPYEKAWASSNRNRYYLVGLDSANDDAFLEEHLVLINSGRSALECIDVQTGKLVWRYSLKTVSGSSGTSTTNNRLVRYNGYQFPAGQILRQGHIALLSSQKQITAVSLINGKALWTQKTLNPEDSTRRNWYSGWKNPVAKLAVGSGVVVEFATDPDTGSKSVRARDLATGSVRWASEFGDESVQGVSAGGGYVGVFTGTNEVIVCDSLNGQQVGKFALSNWQKNLPAIWTNQGLLYISNQQATLVELPTGKVKWTSKFTRGNQQFFTNNYRIKMLTDGRCFILNSGLFMVDMKTGKVLSSCTDKKLGRYVFDADISPDGKEIFAIGYGTSNVQLLSVVDTSTGKLKANMDLGPRYGGTNSASHIAASGNLIPLLISDPPETVNGRKRYTGKASFGFFRKSDGKRVEVSLPGVAEKFTGGMSPIVRGDVIIEMRYNAMNAYRQKPGTQPQILKEWKAPPKKPSPAKKPDSAKKPDLKQGLLPVPQVQPAVRVKKVKLGKVKQGKAVPAKQVPAKPVPVKPAPPKPVVPKSNPVKEPAVKN